MTKELSKDIMHRTRFRHRFLKMKASEAKAKYNKQRIICVSLTTIETIYVIKHFGLP